MGEMYQISATARIQDMENELAGELAELKIEIEENEILQGAPTRPFSSVCIPKDISYFRKERELLLKKGLQVAEAMPLLIQADVMQRELESCLKQEYTVDSLSLLLHQFFTDRIHQLVQCKYLHMLRWKRFCQHTNIIEQIYPLYKKQISRIMKEYDDAVQRARRLSIARECFLTETGNSSKSVTQEDVVIYLQWLVCHLHSVRTIHDYLRMLQYLPMSHNIEVTPEKLFDALADDEDKGSTITLFSSLRAPTRPSTAFSSVSGSAGKTSALLSSAGTHTVSIFNKYSTVMGFEGIFDFEVSFCLPVHKLKIEEFKPQLQYLLSHFSIDYDVDDIRNTANEMELFTLVIRKFRSIFSKEETMKTFPVYDAFETGTEHWGMKGPNMALKKEANWIPFLKLCIRCRVEERVKVCLLDNNVTNKRSSQVTLTFLFYCGFYYISGANYQIKPKQDPWQQKLMTKLKQQKDMDEILRLQSQFFQVSDSNRVMDALRQHAVAAHEPYVVQPLAVTSHHKGQHTSQIWNRIYGNSKLYQEPRCKESGSPIQINACEVENVNRNKHTTSILSSKKNRDQGYSYTSTMQLLGLDEGNEENAKDPVMTQGAYLSLLYLRHLRIRELQRICLGILNYFRSIERTLAINIFGLALNGGKLVHTAADTCWICAAKGGLGVADGMGSHYYLHSTPADYKRYVTEFMEFSEIENHDDFYTTEDGIIHTQDQRGIYIMYDVAIKDLTELENQLLLLATQYIQKGQTTSRISSARGSQCGEVDLQAWAHLSVDRFAVLLDLWRCETAFLENKRQLLDSYFEAYQHVFDVEERFALAQVITDIMHKRPRFNCSSEYFVKTYEAECVCLKLHLQLIREILNKQIDDQREYVQRIWRDGRDVEMGIEFGLPLNIITKQPVAINNSCPALKKIYLLEFHPSLGLASRIPKTLEQAYWELHHIHRPKSADESISLEKQVLNLALEKWAAMEKPESSYSLQVQKDLFSGVFIEDPLFVRDVGLSIIEASEEVENRPGAEKQSQMLHTFSRLLEIITLRHRLIEAASETALLARLYKSVAVQMGFDDFHLYLRPVQFEFAAHKEKADQPPPVFITTLLEDSSSIDRYVPSSLLLAIQEVDENHIGKFSFRTKEAVLQLIAKHGVDNMQIALACQMVQKNSLIAAVQQSLSCPKEKAVHSMDSKDGMSSNKSQDNLVGTSHCSPARESESQQLTLPLGISRSLGSRKQRLSTRKRPPEAFVSIQLEKLGPRDMMLNQFIRKKSTAGSIMKNPEEVEKIKRNLILDYCRKFNERMSQCSLRGQIIAHYNSLLGLLQDFPTARKNYFVLGQPQERKGERDSEFGLISDPRKLHQRPRSLLSTDGRTFLNLWFIPHYSEVLIMFKTLEEKVCQKALYQTLQIVAALHDIFSYLCCFARLGNSPTIGSQKAQPVAADWGGIEGIGSELQDIQAQIDNLHNPRDPATVAKLLVLKREVMFLQFDAAVRHLIRETFLSAGNVAAFQTVTDSMYQALPAMSNSVVSSLYGSLLPLPQPLDAWSHRALALFPWRTFLAREGFVPVMLGNFQSIEYSVQMCLCRLNDRDRSVANAELLGVSLLMEDVVQNGSEAFLFAEKAEELRDESVTKDEQDGAVEEKEDGEQSPGNKIVASLKAKEPISVYMALKSFLILWKQLEVFKEEWGRQKLGVEHINSVTLYKQFCKVYRLEIMYPAMKEITCRLGMEDEYERMMMDNQPLLPPKGTSEVEIKTRQLHKILESMECYMIHELQKKISKEMTLVISERARGEAALPIDFWKHSVMTENFSIMRPQIVESFVQKLKEHSQETDDEIIFRKDHLRDCLMTLACDVMGRERSNFETYSMCYENILRREHQLLYQKEQEMKGMQKSQTSSTTPTIQLADLSHEIIIEITALRAKLANLEEENAKLKDEIRKEVRQEYDALVRHLFASCFALKGKLDEYHINMNKTVCKLISEVRRKGVENMIILKRKIGSTKNDDTLKENLARQDQLQSLREENSKLERLVCQLKTLSCWRQTVKQKQFQRSCTALEQEVIKVKKDYLNIKMLAEEEAVLLRQQLAALRKALSRSLSENEKMKKELEKEKWLLKEYEHRASQELRSRQQLDSMKASNMERLLNDMEEKEQRLHILSNEFEKSSKMAQIQHNKIDKEIKQVRCQLGHERNLKLDAFQRVSELQNQIYDFEAALTLRGSVAGATKKSPSSLCRSASSFRSILPGTGLLTSFRTHSSLTISRDHYQRCLTTNPKTIDSCGTITGGGRRIQRPKTVPSRLHNKVVETLLPELEEPSHHDLLLELQDFRSNQK